MNEIDFPRSQGGAAIGARLRRLSEAIDRQTSRSYRLIGVEFEQRWFGLLNMLTQNGPASVGEIAEHLGITHVSVSQTRNSLQKAGYIEARTDKSDSRRRQLYLTNSGRQLVEQLQPLWRAHAEAAVALTEEAGDVIATMDRLEAALEREDLFQRIERALEAEKSGV